MRLQAPPHITCAHAVQNAIFANAYYFHNFKLWSPQNLSNAHSCRSSVWSNMRPNMRPRTTKVTSILRVAAFTNCLCSFCHAWFLCVRVSVCAGLGQQLSSLHCTGLDCSMQLCSLASRSQQGTGRVSRVCRRRPNTHKNFVSVWMAGSVYVAGLHHLLAVSQERWGLRRGVAAP